LVGNVGKDPETKYLPNGTMVTKFSLATSERYKDKSGEWTERTDWHNVVAWAKLAEIAEKYVKKGNQLFVEGQIQTRSWDDKTSGQKKYMVEINAKELILLGGKAPRDEDVDAAVKPIDDSDIPF
jgi:single-strand DNA-binding protein